MSEKAIRELIAWMRACAEAAFAVGAPMRPGVSGDQA